MSDPVWFVLALILAAILDLGLMAGLRQYYRYRLPSKQQTEQRMEKAVYVFGAYSPVLTWLRYRKIPHLTPLQLPLEGGERLEEAERSERGEETQRGESSRRWYQAHWVEWGIIFLAVTLYCAGILDLRAATRLPGNESEVFQMLDWTLVNSLRDYGKFPLWNPYIQSGVPFVADPMLHVYNPVVTLPVLLFGVPAGFKLGIYISFLIGALGMWKLSHTLGMSRAARLWTALMFAFAGQPAARFFQGQYLFVLGFAYIPWIFSSLLEVRQAVALSPIFSRGWRRAGLRGAIALALLFFSGNAYYPLYVLLGIGLLMLITLPILQRRPPFLKIDLRLLVSYLLIGGLALGLIAIQLLPTAEFWPRLSKDLNLAGSQSLRQVLLDYITKDSYRPDAYRVLPAREEFYAYIGVTPILALSLLPLTLWKRARKPIIFFSLLVALTGVWISLQTMPWHDAFMATRLFIQFRHLLRILVIGSFALITLAGLGLDTLWQVFAGMLKPSTSPHDPRGGRILRGAAMAGMAIVGAYMLIGLLDVFNTNQAILRTQPVYQAAFTIQGWVRQNTPEDSYVRHTPTNAWHEASIANRLHYLDVWYHFADIRSLEDKINQRWVQAQPHYLTQTSQEPDPQNSELVQVVEGYNIFSLPESLPMAFLVEREVLAQDNSLWLQAAEVTPLAPFFSSTSRVELIAEGNGNQVLVLLMTHYPGWIVEVDGEQQPLVNVGGYLAVDGLNGVHKYIFTYQPKSFFIGLVISLTTSLIVGGLLVKELRASRADLRKRWLVGWNALYTGKERLGKILRGWQPLGGRAVYQGGALQLEQPMDLPEDSPVNVHVARQGGALSEWLWVTVRLTRCIPLPTLLFAIGLSVYLLTRLIGLTDWPIYFFTDEAVQTVMAQDFIQNGLRNYKDELMPTYFNKNSTYNLSSLSVYLQVIPYLLFGKSAFVTRAVSVVVSTFGAVMVGLTLRDIFKLRYWWSSVLLLSVAPAWFLHTRTAFETVEMSAFFAGFLYFYLRYRCINPKSLYPALVFGALVFYTYSPGQLIIVVSGIFLLLSDMRYHWQQRKVALRGLLLLGVLVLPFLRYYLNYPDALLQHLTTRAPFWMEDVPFVDKLERFFQEYLSAFDPRYWFIPNRNDLDRHLMQGYGHLSLWMAPITLLGLLVSLFRLRSPATRAVLLALLAAPAGSALVEVGITRILVLIIPAVLMMTIGLNQALEWLVRFTAWVVKRLRGVDPQPENIYRTHTVLALLLAVSLIWANLAMLRDALVNGPLWYQDYTLAGMQYGARQLFSAVQEYYESHPGVEMIVTPNWTNGADAVANFFLPTEAPVRLGSVEGHIFQHFPLTDQMVFVVMPDELDKVIASGKFEQVTIELTLNYPNGQPGFYFIRLRYVENIDEILAAERESRRFLLEDTFTIDGQLVDVRYSMLDMGNIELLFDGNPRTVARTLEANPFIVELIFAEARPVSGVSIGLGASNMQVRVIVTTDPGGDMLTFDTSFTGSVSEPVLELDFGEQLRAGMIRFEILNPNAAEPTNIHVWEIGLQE